MTPTILAVGILPEVTFAIGGASQNLIYDIGINPVSVPTGTNLTLKIILQIVSPSGYVMYENAGWNTSNFSAPDLLTGTAPLPPLTGYTTPESGVYKINIQAQYTDSTGLNPIVTNATVNYSSGNVCVSCLPSPALNIVPNCTNVLLTMTDVTNYVLSGYTFTGVSRVLQAVPPPNSGQISPSTSNKVLQIDNGNEGNGSLWNGLYTINLTGSATYVQGSTTIIQSFSLTQTQNINCVSPFCVMFCALNELNEDYIEALNSNPALAVSIAQKLVLGWTELGLAQQAVECGSDYSGYVANFWTVTGLPPLCGCNDCNEQATGQVLPPTGSTGSGQPGLNGAPGSVWRNGNGAPSNTLGINGDYYLDDQTGNVWQRVSGAYVLVANILGPVGQTGQNGQNGQNGASLFWPTNISTFYTGTGTFNMPAIPASVFENEGDTAEITVGLIPPGLGNGNASILLNTSALVNNNGGSSISVNTKVLYLKVIVQLHMVSTGVYELIYQTFVKAYVNYVTGGILEADFEIQPNTVAYTLGQPVPFQFNFTSCSANASAVFIEGESKKVGNITGGSLQPIYTNPTGGATYQNNDLIGLSPNNFQVQIGGVTKPYPAAWTFVSGTGTINWVGGNPLSSAELNILPF